MFMLTRKRKMMILVIVDSLLIGLANLAAFFFMMPFVLITNDFFIANTVISIGLYILFGTIFRVFTRINRYTNLKEMIAIVSAITCQLILGAVGMQLFWRNTYSIRFQLLTYFLSAFLIIASRLMWRVFIEKRNEKGSKNTDIKRTLILGAGSGGEILYNSLIGSKTAGNICVVGFVDDDKNKIHTYLSGVKVLGTTEQLPELIEKYEIDMLAIAIPSLSNKRLREIFSTIESLNVKVSTMPSLEEITTGNVNVSKLREIDVVDLLGRDEVELDVDSIKHQLTEKVILVTGAGGSIGSEICRQIFKFNPKKIILLGHGENSIYLIDRELRNIGTNKVTEIIPVIADIQDRQRIFEVMELHRPTIVYHAAAHKHVPLMEYNPQEAVKNNIFGTKNVAEASKAAGVEHFVMVSTDKANNPPNVMGATKRIAEMIVTGLNEEGRTKFSAVRFGNVLGSRGSVIPVFREQISTGGPVTVTDFRMTRYFMTIPEASRLVIQSGALASGGEIFVLDMGEPVKIVDLAKNMIRLCGYSEEDIEIVETGIRPGEKLYEELLLDKERNDEKVYEKIFVGNIKGYSLSEVMDFVKRLPTTDEKVAEKIVAFANASNK